MRRDALAASIGDAEALRARGGQVIRRGTLRSRLAFGVMLACCAVTCLFGWQATVARDGSYEGTLAANWSMLGVVTGIGALNFAWGWLSASRRLRETGERLIRRAEYQRKVAGSKLTEADHETLR